MGKLVLYARISTLLIAGVFCALPYPITHAEEDSGTTTEEILIPDEVVPAESATTTEETSAPEDSSSLGAFSEPSLDPTTFYTSIFFPSHPILMGGRRIRQTAGKDGDQIYFSPIIDHAATTVSVVVDFSKLFGDAAVPLEDVFDQYDFPTSNNLLRQFQGGPYTIASGGFNGIVSLLITATDEFGAIAQDTFDVLLDHITPTLSFTSITRASTERLKQGDILLLSGTLDGTGSGARIFNIVEQELAADGTTVLAQSTYSSTHPASPELYALRGGSFADVPLRVYTTGELADFPENVAGVRFVFTIEDEASNRSYATTSTIALDYTVKPPPPPAGPQISNVLFLPGIKGSRLFSSETKCGTIGCDNRVWDPRSNDDVQDLYLTQDGKSSRSDIYVKDGDIIDSVLGNRIYASFIDDMNDLQASTTYAGGHFKWKPVAYDWRLSLDDVIRNGAEHDGGIYYEEATSTPYIEQTLRELARTSGTGKVTIIAHSNGGLVTKALLQKLGDSETAQLVDKIIFVGVPQTGAPQALGGLLFGDREGIPLNFLPVWATPDVARQLAENSPMAYHLMPSDAYLHNTQDPNHSIIGFSGTHLYQAEQSAYGPSIDTVTELNDFLLAREGGRTKPAFADLTIANILNSNLISYANDAHASLDSWVPPTSVSVYQIAGWGANTISGIDFYDEQKLLGATIGYKRQYRPVFVEDGDGVVPVPSALAMSTAPNVHNYWLDLARQGARTGKKKHGDMFEANEMRSFITNLLRNEATVPLFFSTSVPAAIPGNRLIFQLHSPLTLGLYDSNGNYTGLNEDGSVSEQVEGVEYGEFGDVKYLIAPAGTEYELVMNGQTDGTFSLDIQEQSGDTVTTTTIADLPTTASTVARLSITNGVADASTLEVDSDGDGTTDIEVSPVSGETVQFTARTPAEAESAMSPTSGSGAALRSTVVAAPTFTAPLNAVSPVFKPRILRARVAADTITVKNEGAVIQDAKPPSQTASAHDAFAPFAEWLKTLMYNIWNSLIRLLTHHEAL